MSNNTECETLGGYLAEAKIIVEVHKTLEDLSKTIDNDANDYVMRQNEKGKKCSKMKAVERSLSKINLGRFKTYFHGDTTSRTAREFVLKHCGYK